MQLSDDKETPRQTIHWNDYRVIGETMRKGMKIAGLTFTGLLALGLSGLAHAEVTTYHDASDFPTMEGFVYEDSPFPGTTLVKTWSLTANRMKADNACVFLVASTPDKIKTQGVTKEDILQMSCYEPKW